MLPSSEVTHVGVYLEKNTYGLSRADNFFKDFIELIEKPENAHVRSYLGIHRDRTKEPGEKAFYHVSSLKNIKADFSEASALPWVTVYMRLDSFLNINLPCVLRVLDDKKKPPSVFMSFFTRGHDGYHISRFVVTAVGNLLFNLKKTIGPKSGLSSLNSFVSAS